MLNSVTQGRMNDELIFSSTHAFLRQNQSSILVPEDLDELVGYLLGMLFASGCGASTGESSTIVQVRG